MAKRAPLMFAHTEGEPVVWLPFSAYELANLAEMFRAVMPGRYATREEGEEWADLWERLRPLTEHNPLGVFNSGDWAGVCGDRFNKAAEQYAIPRMGNRAAEEYIKEAHQRAAWARKEGEK